MGLIVALLGCAALRAGEPLSEGDAVLRDFAFASGERMAELRMHYYTMGQPRRDPSGEVNNAVLILHGTGGSGASLAKRVDFVNELFAPGQPLDASRFFVIFPDNLGHGQSSKPSDGLRARFPRYGYADMVEAQRRLLAERLGVKRLRLVLGTSMGCMHAWMWGGLHPNAVDALMPLACLPHPITGRNLIWRRMVVDLIRSDVDYAGGEYREQPRSLAATNAIMTLMSQNPVDLQARGGTRPQAEALYKQMIDGVNGRPVDANDRIWQIESSYDYDPRPLLGRIEAAVFAVNFADDPINPPELGILEREIGKVRRARFAVMPATEKTRGHGTHSMPAFWKGYLISLLGWARVN